MLREVLDGEEIAELEVYDELYGLPDRWLRAIAASMGGDKSRPVPEQALCDEPEQLGSAAVIGMVTAAMNHAKRKAENAK